MKSFRHAGRHSGLVRKNFPRYIRPHSDACLMTWFASGAIAQLGERLNGIQEVVSSILIGSTRFL